MPQTETIAERNTRYHHTVDYLSALYDVQLFQRGDTVYPVYVIKPDSSQIEDVDSVCGPIPTDSTPEPFEIYNYAHLNSLQNSGRTLFNGVTYALYRIRTRPLTIEAHLGRYFDMLATCDALKQELYDSAFRRYIRLPLRTQYHRSVGQIESLTSGVGRSAAIGGATLIVFNHQGIYKAMLARRSKRNATDPGFYHTVPAFIYQPQHVPFHADEWRMSYHIYKEFLEELFAMPEVDASAPHDHFYQHPALLDLQAMMRKGKAGLYLTGIAHDLTMLRPEICTLLLIHDAEWYERITAPDSAYPLNAHAETDDGRLLLLPVQSDDSILNTLPDAHYLYMPPQAATALWIGTDLARTLIASYLAQ